MVTTTIHRLGHLGDGIAEGPIFVPMVLPGEVVEGDVIGDHMPQPRIVTPSADRVRAPCPHYKSCGGCALQHASDRFVAQWKADVVQIALQAHGLSTQLRPVQTSPARSRQRAVLAGRRTKKGVIVGFHARGSDTVIAIPDCVLLHPDLMAAFPALQALVPIGASRKAEISFTVAKSLDGVDVSVQGAKPLDRMMITELGTIVAEHGLARLTWNGEPVAELRPPRQQFGPGQVVPPPGAFLQATADGQAALTSAVIAGVGDARRVADLFAGCGTFSLPLAQKAEVLAVESEADMLAALEKGWRRSQGLKRIDTEARDLFRRPLIPDDLRRFDAVVIDPPRAGAESQMEQIAKSTVPCVVGVSCNPLTFARDAAILCAAGFTLEWVQVIDQFRWSPHIEIVARFAR